MEQYVIWKTVQLTEDFLCEINFVVCVLLFPLIRLTVKVFISVCVHFYQFDIKWALLRGFKFSSLNYWVACDKMKDAFHFVHVFVDM